MKWGKLTAGIAFGVGMMALATGSASATQIDFASFLADSGPNVALTTNGGGGVTLTATDTFGGNPNVGFKFINPFFDLTGVPLDVEFVLSANSTANASSGGGHSFQEFAGNFSYVWDGPLTVIGGITLNPGETILHGVFTSGEIEGKDGGKIGRAHV